MGPTRATGSDSDRCRLLEPSDGHRQHPLRPTFPIQLRELFGCLSCTVKGTACFCAWADRGKYDPGCFVSQVPSHAVELAGAYFVRHHKARRERMARQVPRLHASCFPRSSFQELGARGSQEDTTALDSP